MMAETKTNLAAALLAAQSEMEQPKKTATNPHFKSKFAPLDECVRVALAALNKHGIAVMQPTVSTDDGRVGVRTLLLGHGEEMVAGELLGNPPDDPQKVGSWLTYFRRYALSSAIMLAAEEDNDAQAAQPPASKPSAKSGAKSTQKQQQLIHVLAGKLDWDDDKLRAALQSRFGCESTKDLTKSQASDVIEGMQGKVDAATPEEPDEAEDEEETEYSDQPIPF